MTAPWKWAVPKVPMTTLEPRQKPRSAAPASLSAGGVEVAELIRATAAVVLRPSLDKLRTC